MLEENGFQISAGAAFAGRHAFSDKVGSGRPDAEDLAQIAAFAAKAAERLSGNGLPLLHSAEGGRHPRKISESQTAYPFGTMCPLWGVCPVLPHGKHRP